MLCEVEGSDVSYKSILILGEMVYVKPMHEDCFGVVGESVGIRRKLGVKKMRRGEKREMQQFPRRRVSGLFTASGRQRNDHLLGKP